MSGISSTLNEVGAGMLGGGASVGGAIGGIRPPGSGEVHAGGDGGRGAGASAAPGRHVVLQINTGTICAARRAATWAAV